VTTIGVSVAVPDPWGPHLQRYRLELGDESASGIPTHITLLPPIDVDDVLLPEIDRHLRAVAGDATPYLVRMRGTGTFRPVSPVVFVNVVQGISGCEQLAKRVRRGPLAIDTQYPYHPHVTIAHRLGDELLDRAFEEQAGFDCSFTVDRFSLYAHDDEHGWVPQCDYVMGRGSRPASR
jgi:2'-5' RNA ligase